MRNFLQSLFISFVLAFSTIFAAHEYYEYCRSFDRCLEIIQQIKAKGEYLKVLQQYDF